MADDPIQLNDEEASELADVLASAGDQADADRGNYIRQLEDNRLLLQNIQTRDDAPFEGACSLHIPLLRYTSNALAARQVRALLSGETTIFVEGRSQLAQQLAPEVEAFLQLQLRKQVMLRNTWRPVIQEANDDGCSVTYYRWKVRHERKLRYVTSTEILVDPESGEVIGQQKKEEQKRVPVVTYDGPDIMRLPIDYVGTYPAAMGDIQDSQGVFVRMTETGNDILCRQYSSDYNKRAVDALREWAAKGNTGQMKRSDEENAGIGVSDASANVDLSFHNTPFEITEWYWRLPREKNEPAEDWLISFHKD